MTAMEKSITTVIVDDHPFFRDGVSRGLQNGRPHHDRRRGQQRPRGH